MQNTLDQTIWIDHFTSDPFRIDTRLKVSELAERKRYLPIGTTPFPGPWRNEVTPYLTEIMDCFSETSPVKKVAVMKGRRMGFTVGVGGNWFLYILDVAPGPALFVSGDKDMAETVFELIFDQMIESAGLGHKIFAQTEKKSNKKTGDTKRRKDFTGGFFFAIGPNSGAKLKSLGFRYEYFDEVEAYPQEVKEEGDPIVLGERGADEYEPISKFLYTSTPHIDHTSRIKPLFKKGDQRYFYVPCKHCGHKQILKWRDENGNYRLKYETDEMGRLIQESVHYECEKCGGHWKNSDKSAFLGLGEWRATAIPMEPNYRSYHLSSLYSPVGMRSWESICQQWIEAKGDPGKQRVFVNTVLGETWVEKGEAPPHPIVMLKREGYETGTCPGEAYFVTIGADVQKDRIEVEIVAWGKDKESWSVDYITLDGLTSDIDGEVWTKLSDLLFADHAGLPVKMAFIDAGYNTSTVYEFCDQYANVIPVMGDSRVGAKGKPYTLGDLTSKGYHIKRVNLDTHPLKQELYANLQKGKPEKGQPYPAGYCHMPLEYGEKHFRQLMSEEFYPEKTKHGKIKWAWHLKLGRRNEAHDCRLYAMGAMEYFATTAWGQEFPNDEFSWLDFWKWAEKDFPK